MNLYRYSVNLKAGLFALGIIIVVSLLWYTQTLVAELQTNERKLLDVSVAHVKELVGIADRFLA